MDFEEAYGWSVTADEVAGFADDGEYEMSEGWVWTLHLQNLMLVSDRADFPAGGDHAPGEPWHMSFRDWG